MEKLSLNLENCYGIKKLEHTFEFDENNRTYAIYAPNGVMKTSFAKTISDFISKDKKAKDSRDQIFNREPYVREINNESGQEFDKDAIFVIKSFVDTGYSSDKLSTLLVRSELRERYENILESLKNLKKPIINRLISSSASSDCEDEIIRTFSEYGDNFFEIINSILGKIESEGKNISFERYSFKYNDVFDNSSVNSFLKNNKDNIQTYYDTYYSILEGSDGLFTKDGKFGTLQASNIAKSVADDSFFQAGHKFILNNKDKPIESVKDFQDILEEAKSKILSNPDIKKQFEKIDGALAPSTLSGFREVIKNDRDILLELINFDDFQKKYWITHLFQLIDDLNALNDQYIENKKDIDAIIDSANDENEKWKDALKLFSSRFLDLPFKVDVKNKKGAVLGLEQPELVFTFIDRENDEVKEEVERNFLTTDVLSNGEKRAFYILNIIFEIQSRLHNNQKTLFIIDDIADSFDYKNKYAIIEYLHDLSRENDYFSSIILTHNFDFYRAITLRLNIDKEKRFFAQREIDRISLVGEEDVCPIDPFKKWKSDMSNISHVFALIPFVRNLIEYGDDNKKAFTELTYILHKKSESKFNGSTHKRYKGEDISQYDESNGDYIIKSTEDITFADIEESFKKYLNISEFSISFDKDEKVIERLIECADSLGDIPSLENKIILAIGIRYLAEKFMIEKINKPSFTDNIPLAQTSRLLKKFKGKILSGEIVVEDNVLETLERVNILTPENIHINSFMYEPIIDIGITEIKNLYEKAKEYFVSSEL